MMFTYEVTCCCCDLAGGSLEAPFELVKREPVDIEVRADTEIVTDGYIPPKHIEEEGPFNEGFGVISPRRMNPVEKLPA